jgi:hypothetical protein
MSLYGRVCAADSILVGMRHLSYIDNRSVIIGQDPKTLRGFIHVRTTAFPLRGEGA